MRAKARMSRSDVWMKYFTSNVDIPKDFVKQYPNLVSFLDDLSIEKQIDKASAKKKISSDSRDADEVLYELFHLAEQKPSKVLEVFNASLGYLSGKQHSAFKVVLEFMMINFIRFSLHFSSYLKSDEDFSECFIEFAIHCKNVKFQEEFVVIYETLLRAITQDWEEIFLLVDERGHLKLIQWISAAFRFASFELTNFGITDGLDHLVEHISKYVSMITPEEFEEGHLYALRDILNHILTTVGSMPQHMSVQVSRFAGVVLSCITNCEKIRKDDIYMIGCVCLNIFIEAWCVFEEDLVKKYFWIVLSYVTWTILSFPDEGSEQVVVMPHLTPKLGEISTAEYFEYAPTVPEMPSLVVNERLSEAASALVSICFRAKNEPLLVQLFISALKSNESKMTDKQYQSLTAFLLHVIAKIRDESLFLGFRKNWSVLVCDSIFPPFENATYDKRLSDSVLYIQLRSFINIPESRLEILTSVVNYVKRNGLDGLMLHFMPLLNSLLLVDGEVRFAADLMKSNLIMSIVDVSSSNLVVFDFLRLLTVLHPRICFENSILLEFFSLKIRDDVRRPSILKCFKAGFLCVPVGDSQDGFIFCLLSHIAGCFDNVCEENEKYVVDVLNLLDSTAGIGEGYVKSVMSLNMLDVIADVNIQIATCNCFIAMIRYFTSLCMSSAIARGFFGRTNAKIYRKMAQFCDKREITQEAAQTLWNFVQLKPLEISNCGALIVFLKWARSNSDQELWIYEKLLDLISQKYTVLFNISRQEISSELIQRLLADLPENVEESLFKLYSKILEFGFSNAISFETIHLLNSYKNPDRIFTMLLNVLASQSERDISSYFHFDDRSDEITIEGLNMPDETTFNAVIRIEMTAAQPLLKILNSDGTQVFLFFEDNTLKCQLNEEEPSVFGDRFECSRWYDISITFTLTDISLSVNGVRNETPIPNEIVKIVDHAVSMRICYGDFCGDLSEFAFVDSESHDICRCKPANVKKNVIVGALSGNRVKFYGMTVTNFVRLNDAIKSPMFALQLLPLLDREECRTAKFFSFFTEVMKYSQQVLTEHRFFMLFAAYLEKFTVFRPYYLDFIKNIYKNITFDDYGIKMVESIILNFAIIDKFESEEMKAEYFGAVLPDLYHKNKVYFDRAPCFEYYLHNLIINYSHESKTAECAWKFVLELAIFRNSFADFELLLAIPSNITYRYAVIASVTTIREIMTANNPLMNSALQVCHYFSPFTRILGNTDISSVQIVIVQLMSIISKLVPREKTETAVYQAIVAYKNGDKPQSVLNYLFSAVIAQTFKNPSYGLNALFFPLFVTMCCKLPPEITLPYYTRFIDSLYNSPTHATCFTQISQWHWWLFKLISLFYSPTEQVKEFAVPVSILFQSSNENVDLIPFIQSAIEVGLDVNKLIKEIVVIVFGRGLAEQEKILSVFPFMFFYAFMVLIFDVHVELGEDDELPAPAAKFPELKDLFGWNLKTGNIEFEMNTCLNEKNEWADIHVAEIVLSFYGKVDAFDVDFAGPKINSMVLFTYIACLLIHFGSSKVSSVLELIIADLENAPEDIAQTCASLLMSVCENDNDSVHIDSHRLEKYVRIFEGEDQTMELQKKFLDRFESSVVSKAKKVGKLWTKQISEYKKRSQMQLLENLGLGEVTGEDYFDSVSSLSYRKLKATYDFFMSKSATMLVNRAQSVEPLLSGFVNEMKTMTGPWHDESVVLHYRALNRISIHGRRVLMALNHHFTDHAQAAKARDDGGKAEEELNSTAQDRFGKIGSMDADEDDEQRERFCADVRQVTLRHDYSGVLTMTPTHLSFEGSGKGKNKRFHLKIRSIIFIMKHTCGRKDNAAEIHTSTGKAILLVFQQNDRQAFFRAISQVAKRVPATDVSKFNLFKRLREVFGIVQNATPVQMVSKLQLTSLWQKRQISNFEYLYCLNILSGRSFNDMTQYPVYPWVLQACDHFDINDRACYRDLSKHMGSLCPERFSDLKDSYREMDDPDERCLYRTFYSNSLIISNLLIRVEPFTSLHIEYQDQKFDHSSRLFASLDNMWNMVYMGPDARELIPEFFSFPELLVNKNHFDFGGGVDDVVLPAWAESPFHFIETNLRALESEIATESLPKWIDMIFGVNRRVKDDFQTFHPFCYMETKPSYEEMEILMEQQVTHFGVSPMQALQVAHPQRNPPEPEKTLDIRITHTADVIAYSKQYVITDDMSVVDIESANQEKIPLRVDSIGDIIKASRSQKLLVFAQTQDTDFTIFTQNDRKLRRIDHDHSSIQCMDIVGGSFMLTGSADGVVRVWSLPECSLMRSSSYQAHSIIAIAGNREIGLLVSVDSEYCVIFETMFEPLFIRLVQLPKAASPPLITVFKSGRVAIVTSAEGKSTLHVFSVMGESLGTLEIQGTAKDIKKFYDVDSREFLVVAVEPRSVMLVELTRLKIVTTVNKSLSRSGFTMLKERKAFVTSQGRLSQAFNFEIPNDV